MPRKPCTFRQSDLTRALKAVKAAGVEAAIVKITRDEIVVKLLDKAAAARESSGNEWDVVYDADSAPVRSRVS